MNSMPSTQSDKVVIFGKLTCRLCDAAKEKFKLLNIPYKFKEIEPLLELHNGWRTDGSVDLQAFYQYYEHVLPIIKMDEKYFTYPLAMAHLKDTKKAQAPVKEAVLVPA